MNTPFNFFDKIFCINLQKRPDRWSVCQEHFEKLNITDNVVRFNAVDFTDDNTVSERDKGRYGCTQSHIEIVKLAKNKQYKNILIFEDDIHLHTSIATINNEVAKCIEQLPNDWEIFYLSGNPIGPDPYESLQDYSDNLCLVTHTFTTHAMAINENAYDIILNSYTDAGGLNNIINRVVNIDGFYMAYVLPNNKSFMPKKLLFTQRHNYSDIDFCDRDINSIIIETYKRKKILIP
jgi:hypothetical protein